MDPTSSRATRRRRAPWTLYPAAIALVWAVVGVGAPVAAQAEARPVVIDTDLGADDVLALAWLVDRRELDIRAITVSGTGLVSCEAGVPVLRALLVALDATGPDVGCGSATARGSGTPFPAEWRAAADAGHGLELPPAPDAADPWRPAEQIIGEILDAAVDPVGILALGPLTTIASRARRSRAGRARRLTDRDAGRRRRAGERPPRWGIDSGSRRVERPCESRRGRRGAGGRRPADAGRARRHGPGADSQTLATALAEGGPSPAAALAARLVAATPWVGEPGSTPWDALAAVAFVDRSVIDTRERLLQVVPSGPDAGALRVSDAGLPAQVALGADRTAFELALLEGLRGGVPSPDQSPAAMLTITGDAGSCTLDVIGTPAPGPVLVRAAASDAPLVAVLAALIEGYGIADPRSRAGGGGSGDGATRLAAAGRVPGGRAGHRPGRHRGAHPRRPRGHLRDR